MGFLAIISIIGVIFFGIKTSKKENLNSSRKWLIGCCIATVIFTAALGSTDNSSPNNTQSTPIPTPTAAATNSPTPEPTATPTPTPEPTATPTPIPTPEPTVEPTLTPVAEQSTTAGTRTVYAGNTGTKYHKQNCPTLKGKGHAVSLDDAIAEGRTPCKRCNP